MRNGILHSAVSGVLDVEQSGSNSTDCFNIRDCVTDILTKEMKQYIPKVEEKKCRTRIRFERKNFADQFSVDKFKKYYVVNKNCIRVGKITKMRLRNESKKLKKKIEALENERTLPDLVNPKVNFQTHF